MEKLEIAVEVHVLEEVSRIKAGRRFVFVTLLEDDLRLELPQLLDKVRAAMRGLTCGGKVFVNFEVEVPDADRGGSIVATLVRADRIQPLRVLSILSR